MAKLKDAKIKTIGEVIEVNTDRVLPYPDQPRKEFDSKKIERLRRSIVKDGQRSPCQICDVYDQPELIGKYFYLVDGENRHRACKLAGLKLSATQISIKNAREHFYQSAVANLNRQALQPLEIAQTIKAFREIDKMKWFEIIDATGMSQATLDKYLRLANLCPEGQELLKASLPREKRLSLAIASELAYLPQGDQKKKLEEIKELPPDKAKMTIRKAAQALEKKGVVLQRNGRKRKPSDEASLVDARIKRIAGDLDFLLSLDQEYLVTAFKGRGVLANAETCDVLAQISILLPQLSDKLKKAMPDSYKAKLPAGKKPKAESQNSRR